MKQISELIEGHPLFHVDPDDTVRSAAEHMAQRNVGAVPVIDSGRLVGVFSERDIMSRVVAKGLDPGATAVGTVMSKEIVVAAPDEDIDAALAKMHSINCRHLPVVRDGNLVGMLSLRDLLEIDDADNKQRATFLRELVTYSLDYES